MTNNNINISSKSRGTTPFNNKTRSPSPAVDYKKRAFSLQNGMESPQCEVHPFSRSRRGSAAAPSSTTTKLNLRKRSPSPVVTGKVSSFRSKFESVPNTPPTPTWSRHTTRTREPHEIFSNSLPNQYHLNSPGNIRTTGQKLSRDSSSSSFNNSSLPRNPSSSRLPNHFINIDSCEAVDSSSARPKINRAQSLRTPRYFSPSDNNSSTTQHAATYLRQILPKMSEDSKLRGPFGYRC